MKSLKQFALPYTIWMMILVLIPTFLVLLLSFSSLNIYSLEPFKMTIKHLDIVFRPEVKIAILNSIKFSLIATIICFIIGYPVAYHLARYQSKYKTLFLTLLIIPVWSNMLLRIIAWEKLFYPNSILNMFGISLDLIGSDLAIIIGMTSMYLPFMVLPIYSVLDKMDDSLLEAANDLGAPPIQTFLRVTFPLSISGVVSGIIMTLLPSMTAFALPERLSGGKTLLIGNLIEDYFMKTNNVNAGSFISLILMIVILAMFLLILRFDKEGDTLL